MAVFLLNQTNWEIEFQRVIVFGFPRNSTINETKGRFLFTSTIRTHNF